MRRFLFLFSFFLLTFLLKRLKENTENTENKENKETDESETNQKQSWLFQTRVHVLGLSDDSSKGLYCAHSSLLCRLKSSIKKPWCSVYLGCINSKAEYLVDSKAAFGKNEDSNSKKVKPKPQEGIRFSFETFFSL